MILDMKYCSRVEEKSRQGPTVTGALALMGFHSGCLDQIEPQCQTRLKCPLWPMHRKSKLRYFSLGSRPTVGDPYPVGPHGPTIPPFHSTKCHLAERSPAGFGHYADWWGGIGMEEGHRLTLDPCFAYTFTLHRCLQDHPTDKKSRTPQASINITIHHFSAKTCLILIA